MDVIPEDGMPGGGTAPPVSWVAHLKPQIRPVRKLSPALCRCREPAAYRAMAPATDSSAPTAIPERLNARSSPFKARGTGSTEHHIIHPRCLTANATCTVAITPNYRILRAN